jgi:hypothetical protein
MQILDAYSHALGIPTLSEMVASDNRRRRENEFHPIVPVNQEAAIERNRFKWEKKAEKAKKLNSK